MTNIDLTILDNHPEALAKITEALAKVYFDNVRHNPDKRIADAYSVAFNLCPNYRLILKDKPGYERFKSLSWLHYEITSLPIISKSPLV